MKQIEPGEPATEAMLNDILNITISPYDWTARNEFLSHRLEFDDEIPVILRGAQICVSARKEIYNRQNEIVQILPAEGRILTSDMSYTKPPREITVNEANVALNYFSQQVQQLKGGKEWSPEEIQFRLSLTEL
jgi:hypothetical protein